jgi:ATP phosphoribosyltransferase
MRLAVPNKGRLMEPTLELLRKAGLAFERTERSLTVPVRNVPIDLLFVRTDDVVEMVADGVAETGIAGLDLLAESGLDLEVVTELGYGRCRLAAAVPKDSEIGALEDLGGLRVATAHPRVTRRILAGKGHPFFCSQFVVYVYQFVAEQNRVSARDVFNLSDVKVSPSELASKLQRNRFFNEAGYMMPNER